MLRRQCWKKQILLAAAVLLGMTGCINLGGKTYVEEKPETAQRLCDLERRVGVLEHSFIASPMPEMLPRPAPQH